METVRKFLYLSDAFEAMQGYQKHIENALSFYTDFCFWLPKRSVIIAELNDERLRIVSLMNEFAETNFNSGNDAVNWVRENFIVPPYSISTHEGNTSIRYKDADIAPKPIGY